MRVTFRCGHHGDVSETAMSPPVCACGEHQIVRVVARPPRFRGTCSGPYSEYVNLDPGIVDVAPKGPLHLTPAPKED